jgi:hypothetical protein
MRFPEISATLKALTSDQKQTKLTRKINTSMKKVISILLFIVMAHLAYSQQLNTTKKIADSSKPFYDAEASCGSCNFKMQRNGCFLAIRFNGKFYFVTGTGIDDYGDAHDKEGFCNAIRKVKVQGDIQEENFNVSYFEFRK